MRRRFLVAAAAIALSTAILTGGSAQKLTEDQMSNEEASEPKGTFLLTIFLKHDQSKPLEQINAELRQQGFYKAFPPPGIEVVSWYVMMGIGQVVTLRVPAERLREVNRAIETTAWGGYRTEFYPTYDLKAVAEKLHTEAQ
jgi:hypothetical protein